MAFVDLEVEQRYAGLESMDAESVRQMSEVGVDKTRSRLIAVAIMADMEKKGRTLAVVVRPYGYVHDVLESRIEIPTGFVTDFASIPSGLHWLIHPFGRHAPAAVIHDFLYAIGDKGKRRFADKIFRDAMKDSGVPYLRRSVMYRMVRLFGGGGYGLEADWSFVDSVSGDPLPEAPSPPLLSYRDREAMKTLRAERKAAAKA
ncbi:MAG: DUF1353 domain-containing protein [Pseudomonadota bacterium]